MRFFKKSVGVVYESDSGVVSVLCFFQNVIGELTYIGGLEDRGGAS
jgi:hypothetical protein